MKYEQYTLISDAISSVICSYHPWAISKVTTEAVEALSQALAEIDPWFDSEGFLRDCGLRRKVEL